MQIEDLGFCKKGEGGKFVSDGNLISGVGKLPFNTDGGGLCNNHPDNRGGITKVIEAVRQLRGEAHPKVQVANCDLAIAHGTGGSLGTRHAAAHGDHGTGGERCPRPSTDPPDPGAGGQRRDQAVLGRGQEGRFLIKRCTACGKAYWYPRAICPFCMSAETVLGGEPGEGVIYTYSGDAPLLAGPLRHRLCDPERGAGGADQLRRLRPDGLTIGMKVKVKFQPTEGGRRCRCSRRRRTVLILL